MKTYCALFGLFIICLIQLDGASPINDLAYADVPFVGERTSEASLDSSGRKLTINYTNAATEVQITKNNQAKGVLRLRNSISIYCVRWFDGFPWFILREQAGPGTGSFVVAIVEFKESPKGAEFIYYCENVSSKDLTGRLFELVDVDRDKITVISSFDDFPEKQKISYLKGSIKRSELMKTDVKRILVENNTNTDKLKQETESINDDLIEGRKRVPPPTERPN